MTRLPIDQGEMQKKTSLKSKFSRFNDKRFYFSDGVTSVPLFHPLLKDQAEYKNNKREKIENFFWDEKEALLKKENEVQKQHEWLLIYHQIVTSVVNCFPLEQKDNFQKYQGLWA